MDRRAAASWAALMMLGGCGGGGGGPSEGTATTSGSTGSTTTTTTTPAPAPPQAPATAPIAAWGDSLTPAVVANLRLLYPSRDIFNGGVVGQTSTQIAERQLADGNIHSAWINIFWYGQNNPGEPTRIKDDLAASIASLAPGNNRFLVLSVVNKNRTEEIKGGPIYDGIIQLNGELAATYPGNYLDVRAYLVSQYNPSSAQEVQDFQNDVVPTSLRFDEIHLNNDGSVLVAGQIRDFIDAKGW